MDRQKLLRSIERAAAEGWRELDLAGWGIEELPKEIGKCRQLEKLDLGRWDKESENYLGNKISHLPEELWCLSNLRHLSVCANQLSEIPEAIGQLSNLSVLDLSNNQLSEIPEAIGQLSNLSVLDLSNNQINEIPKAIGQLSNLSQLYLDRNKISEMPEAIGQLQQLSLLTRDNNHPLESTDKSLAEIGVGGFKSLVDLTKIKLSALSILAGTNSSGKSSMMQPLLLMKQTLEAPYDPGILLLDGSNVKFTSSQQFISTKTLTDDAKQFQIFLALDRLDFQSNFQWSTETGFSLRSQIFTLKRPEKIEEYRLRPDMTTVELRKIPLFASDPQPDTLHVLRERCFLNVKGLEGYTVGSQKLTEILRSMIHVPGVRNNPERIYKTAATDGNTFIGLFENYVASVIDRLQKEEPQKLEQLQSHLRQLGLTDTIQAQRLNETQLELRVGRVLGQSDSQDTVNIADVGFGVSQVLPVVVALVVAQPGQLVYIEQPEIHLHPRAQIALADVFAAAINRGVQVVVETHSELFLLGIQTLVAENQIAPNDVQLHWFTRNPDGSSYVTTAELDETGAFGDWPEDFGATALGLENRYLSAAERKLWHSEHQSHG